MQERNIQLSQVCEPLSNGRAVSPDTRKDEVKQGRSSLIGASFVQAHNAIGTGLLLFPYTFWAFGGLAGGILIQLMLVVLIAPSLFILAYSAEAKQVKSYQDVISHLCGPVIGKICQVCISLAAFGAGVGQLILIGDQLIDMSSAFTVNNGSLLSEQWYFDRRFSTPILAIAFILPLLMLKNIGSLSYTSFIGFVSSLYIAAIVIIKYFIIDDNYFNCKSDSDLERSCHSSWTIAANSISFACTAYENHVSSVPVYFGLKKRSVRRYIVVIVTVMSSCLIVYSITGAFGYLTFNGRVCISGDVLRNYCPRDIPISIARVMIVVSLITLYPITCYIGRSAFDSILMELLMLIKHKPFMIEYKDVLRSRFEATLWFLLTLGLAIFIPDILVVMRPLGGLASMFMLTFPGLCLLNLLLSNLIQISFRVLKPFLYISAGAYIAIGCYILGSSVTYSIMSEAHVFPK